MIGMSEKVVLASRSPRRRELLSLILDEFAVISSDFDESSITEQDPEKLVKQLSCCKARSVFSGDADLVIGADTVVVSPEGTVFGIPKDRQAALDMLSALSGRKHQVMTGVTLIAQGYEDSFCVKTEVFFRALEQAEKIAYIESGEPFDKAGGYGIQGKAAVFTEKIEGDYFNVVGLPVSAVYMAIKKWKKTKNS